MTPEWIEWALMLAFSSITLLAAVGFVAFRDPVYATLCFVLSIVGGTGLYLLQNAPYVAASTIVIYAGAIIIIFLFVLMFAQHSHLQRYEVRLSNPLLSGVAAALLIGVLVFVIATSDTGADAASTGTIAANGQATDADVGSESQSDPEGPDARDPGSESSAAESSAAGSRATEMPRVADLGREFYTRYLWSVELAGTLLLVAAAGAIVMARRDPTSPSATRENHP